jgi:hypothetical protein
VPEGADSAQRRPESGRVTGLGNELGEHPFHVGVAVRFGHHRRQPLEELVDPFRSEPDVVEDVVVSGVAHATPHGGPRPRKVACVDGVQREPEQ